jgi:hypothetical protein
LLADRLKPSGEFFYRGPMFVIDGLKTIGCFGSLNSAGNGSRFGV